MNRWTGAAVGACLLINVVACGGGHDDDPLPFSVALGGCTEYVGATTVPSAGVASAVAPSFTAVQSGGTTAFKVRASACDRLGIDGGPSQPTVTLQIGVSAVAPAGSDVPPPGFSYQFAYLTNNAELAERMRRWGMAVEHDPALRYVYTPQDAANGLFEATAHSARLGTFTLTGAVTPSTSNATPIVVPFVAEWSGAARDGGVVTMRTQFPAIAIGVTPAGALPSVTLRAAPGSLLASWIGGDSIGFSVSGRFNNWDNAVMNVDLRH